MDGQTHPSLYLRWNRIRVFKSTIRLLGTPKFVQFSVHQDGTSMILSPFDKKSFTSFRIPANIYDEKGSLEISSKGLCRILANRLNWNVNQSYRIPGKYISSQNIVVYDLTSAAAIPYRSVRNLLRDHKRKAYAKNFYHADLFNLLLHCDVTLYYGERHV